MASKLERTSSVHAFMLGSARLRGLSAMPWEFRQNPSRRRLTALEYERFVWGLVAALK